MMVLDECPPGDVTEAYARASNALTLRWAARCKQRFDETERPRERLARLDELSYTLAIAAIGLAVALAGLGRARSLVGSLVHEISFLDCYDNDAVDVPVTASGSEHARTVPAPRRPGVG